INDRKLIIIRHPAISAGDGRCRIRSNSTVLPVPSSAYDGCLFSFKYAGGPIRSSVCDRGQAASGSLGLSKAAKFSPRFNLIVFAVTTLSTTREECAYRPRSSRNRLIAARGEPHSSLKNSTAMLDENWVTGRKFMTFRADTPYDATILRCFAVDIESGL